MKLIRNSFLIVCCLLSLQTRIYSQSLDYAEPSKIIPPSPDVAAMQRFGEIPISPYTGVPNISVPIYTIKTGDIEIPISINYHASGIKVADEASRVGLGWALNAGGVITRTIMNMDDFASRTDGYHFPSNTPDVGDGIKGNLGTSFNMQDCGALVNGTQFNSYLQQYFDFEPDVYSFNFLGYSGTFIMKRNKDVILLKNEKLKITHNNINGGTWEIKTPDGATYLFEVHEDYIDYFSEYNGGQPAINAWHLTKIISSRGHTADFVYQTVGTRIRVHGSFFQTAQPNELPNLSPGLQLCDGLEGRVMYALNLPNKEYSKIYLDKINFDNGNISFQYGSREDIENDIRLETIQLNRGASPIKSWALGYDYFEGLADGDRDVVGTLSTRSKRLKLNTITEKAGTGEESKPYIFVYKASTNEPQKTSFAIDHWGYFNGKYVNFTPVPGLSENVTEESAAKIIGIFGENRNVVPEFNQLFILNEIQYPTGGKTIFEYETHDFDIEKSKVNDFSFFKTYPEILRKPISKHYFDLQVYNDLPLASQTADYILDLTDLTVDENLPNPTAKVSLKAFFRYNGTAQDPCVPPSGITATLCYENGIEISEADIAAFLTGPNDPPPGIEDPQTTCDLSPTGNPMGATFKNTYYLPPGKYLWKVSVTVDFVLSAHLLIEYNADKILQEIVNSGDNLTGADFGGGLRIRKISNFDNIHTTPINVKRYSYHYTDDDGKIRSYGKRMAAPVYAYFDKKYYRQFCGSPQFALDFETYTKVVQSESLIPLESSVSGSAVGYDKVIVFEGEYGENGKTEYEFENEPHVILDYSSMDYLLYKWSRIPTKPPPFGIVQNYSNGNLLKQKDFKNVSGVFIPVKETINDFTQFVPSNHAVLYGIERRQKSGTIDPYCQYVSYIYPTITKSRKLLTSSTTKIYDQNDPTKYSTQTVTNTYDNATHLQLTSTRQVTSKGDEIAKTFTYPLDYTDVNSDPAILQMKGSGFMHSSPVTQYTTLQKVGTSSPLLMEGAINKYQYQDNLISVKEVAIPEINTLSALPSYDPSLNQYPPDFKPRLKFNKYDSKGNILEMQKVNNISLSYIWNDTKSYPIAEVVNAQASDIFHTSFEDSEGNSVDGDSKTGKKSRTGGYSRSLLNLTNGQYILSYWQKPSSIWILQKTNITVSGNSYPINLAGQVDEVRFYPVIAQMTTYTYEPLVGMTSKTDASDRTIYYEYDSFGRLNIIRDQDQNIIKKLDYKFQATPQQ